MVPGQGFEPRFSGPEPDVLPLDDPGSREKDSIRRRLFQGYSSVNKMSRSGHFIHAFDILLSMVIRHFSEISREDTLITGGKGASLGEMTQAGIPVPDGFVVLAGAFDEFLKENGLDVEIDAALDAVNLEAVHTVESASEKLQTLIMASSLSKELVSEIEKAFKDLDAEFVAVRSSATAEDGVSAAWAGQLDTFLNTTNETLIENIKKCWASLFTPRAIFYRLELGTRTRDSGVGSQQILPPELVEGLKSNEDTDSPSTGSGNNGMEHDFLSSSEGSTQKDPSATEVQKPQEIKKHISVAVVIQKMVQSEVAGVAFSVHPVTQDPNQLIIEAGWGLGEAIVSGEITPDSYVVDKENWNLLDINVSEQEKMIVKSSSGGDEWVNVLHEKISSQKLSESQIIELSKLIVEIEKHYGFACDIEWSIVNGKFWITQSRPITTL